MNVNEGPFTSNYLQNLDLSKYNPARIDTHDFEGVDFTPGNFNYQGVDPSSPEFGGIMEIDTELINDYNPEDRSTWFDTHPATGEAVLKPETGYDYTNLNKRGYSAHEFDQLPWDKTQIDARPYRYNYSEMGQKPSPWWKWLPKM